MPKAKLTLRNMAVSSEYQDLMLRFPKLKQDLQTIYDTGYAASEAFQDNPHSGFPAATHVSSKAQERQDQKAIAALRQLRESNERDAHSAAGLDAFAALVRSISQNEAA